MSNILFIDCHDDSRERVLRDNLQGDWSIDKCALNDPHLATALDHTQIAITSAWTEDMQHAPALRLVQIPGAGFDGVHFAAVPHQAAICNTFEHEIGMSEYIVLATLEWQIRLARMNERLRRDEWKDGFVVQAPLHGELFDKTVGFIGYGHIARATAARLKPFGVRLIARTRSPDKDLDALCDDIGGMNDINTLLEQCHYIVVTCPLTDETSGLINATHFAKMRHDAVLINVARGPIVDETALFEACKNRQIGGAVIDTWYRYPDASGDLEQRCPPSSYPFNSLDNVILSSHASGWSEGLFDRRMTVIADNINRLVNDEPLLNVLRPSA